MQYLKRNTKYSILAFLVIVLSITISISTLAKTEVYFSLYYNPQILSTTSLKQEVQPINTNIASKDELIRVSQISKPFT
jgi:predicted metal-dependent peptidase